MDHVRFNAKREQMLEDRYSEIDRENRLLLKKMSDIMKNQNTPRKLEPLGPQSLNRDFRKKELLRITKENQSILKRIQQAQPEYNHIQWETDHRRNRYFMLNAMEHSHHLRVSKREMVTSELIPLEADEHVPETARSGAPQVSLPIEIPLYNDAVKYVLKESRTISGSDYLVEMSTDGRSLNVIAYNGEFTHELSVKEQTYRKLYRLTDGDHALLADRLYIGRYGGLFMDESELGTMSAPATARGISAPPVFRPAASAPSSARERGEGRAAQAAEGVRERAAAFLQHQEKKQQQEAPPNLSRVHSPPASAPAPKESSARKSPPPLPQAQPEQPKAQPLQPQAPVSPNSGQIERAKSAEKLKSDELGADQMVVAAPANESPTSRFAVTVHSAGFVDKPVSAGSALVCEVDLFGDGTDPQVHLRGLTPPDQGG
jgi:E3 ubiquitin-protein ligase TRIP12